MKHLALLTALSLVTFSLRAQTKPPTVKAKVLRVRDGMAYVKMSHNYGWIENTHGAKRKDVIMVCLTNIK